MVCICLKMFEFFNAFRSTRVITEMFLAVTVDLFPFLKVFVWLIAVFAFLGVCTEIRVCEDDKDGFECDVQGWDDYPDITKFSALFLNTFRTSVGDISAPMYSSWSDRKKETKKTTYAAIYLIWIIWLVNVFIMLIIMLNFLIAEVGNTYQKVYSLGEKSHYRASAVINFKVQQYLYFFRKWLQFDAIVFTTSKETYLEEGEQS